MLALRGSTVACQSSDIDTHDGRQRYTAECIVQLVLLEKDVLRQVPRCVVVVFQS